MPVLMLVWDWQMTGPAPGMRQLHKACTSHRHRLPNSCPATSRRLLRMAKVGSGPHLPPRSVSATGNRACEAHPIAEIDKLSQTPEHAQNMGGLRYKALCHAVVLAPYAQCGGINNAPTPAQSGDFPWNSTECSQDFQCLSNANPWFYQVRPASGLLLCRWRSALQERFTGRPRSAS